MKKYKVGLVIGRFQPFHNGHKYLFDKALYIAEKIVVGIGSSNVTNSDNPFGAAERIKMVKEFVKKEKIKKYITKIVSLADTPNDDVWLQETLKKTGRIDVVIGNNDWVSGIFKNAHIPVVTVGHYKRYMYEGKKIRYHMKHKKSWDERVPTYLVEYITMLSKSVV